MTMKSIKFESNLALVDVISDFMIGYKSGFYLKITKQR